MSQNSIIAFALILGFIVFITVKGELPKYLAVFGIGGAAPASSSGGLLNDLGSSLSLPSLPSIGQVR